MRYFRPSAIWLRLALVLGCCAALQAPAGAQGRTLSGRILDAQSEEPVPFASVRLRSSGAGTLTDSAGRFRFTFSTALPDTVEVTSVGFRDLAAPLDNSRFIGDSAVLVLRMEPGKFTAEVVVRKRVNRGLQFWKRIVLHKPQNDRYRFENFSYELYNKLELDLKNVNTGRMDRLPVIKKLGFIKDFVDTVDGAPTLPAYLTETLSQYYYARAPQRRREEIMAVKTMGVQNESAARLLGGMDQNVNVYNNFIPVLDKQFVSPLSEHGDAYYRYRVADTQYVGGRRLIHFLFTPKSSGTNTFEGDAWVHDSTFAIQKINLRLGKDANLNYVERLSLIQEYAPMEDGSWFLSRDKFVVDFTLLGKASLTFIGRKNTTYRNVKVNDSSVLATLAKNKRVEEIILPPGSTDQSDAYWSGARHDSLSATEAGIYRMIDTLLRSPTFVRTTRLVDFIGTGYRRVGNYHIGPWQNWVSSNSEEGLRLRFDLSTNRFFHPDATFHGYLARGFGDGRWKGALDGFYLFDRQPRTYLFAAYVNDFDYGQSYYDEISSDNLFALAIRKEGVPIKFIRLREVRLEGFREWPSGFSLLLSGRDRRYDPVRNLPGAAYFVPEGPQPFRRFEISARLRFAYLEKFLENSFYRTSLGSPYPIGEVRYSRGFAPDGDKGYHKISGSVSNYSTLPPFGTVYFNLFGGRTIGTEAYTFLDVAPGNEMYYYNRQAFNLMNRYEYIHDRYLGLNVEHIIGNGLFRLLPVTRKLGFRQLYTVKALRGRLSAPNAALNLQPGTPFRQLSGKTYVEAGTGIDNILKVFRLDFIWRLTALESGKAPVDRFGVFGSFRFAF